MKFDAHVFQINCCPRSCEGERITWARRLTSISFPFLIWVSIRLYKFQLEAQQRELHRAQSVFNIVEKERYDAELQGAKSRTAARRLHEQHKIHLAREEGRRIGLQEGLEAGRSGFGDEPRNGPPLSNFGDDYYDGDFDDEALDSLVDYDPLEEFQSPSPPRNSTSILPPGNNLRDTPDPVPIPPPVPQPAPMPAPQTAAPLSPLFAPFHDIHPTPVHNEVPHPRHQHIDVPPDGFIPSTGPDSLPLVPPPHELSPQPDQSPPRSRVSSVVEERVIAPSAFARAMSPRQHADRRSPSQRAQSIRAESVRRAPSAVAIPSHLSDSSA